MSNKKNISFPCIEICQPIGTFYIGTMLSGDLRSITYSDIRRIGDREIEVYTGIQRELKTRRVKEIGEYVNTLDACFPTGVILSISSEHASFDKKSGKMSLSNIIDSADEIDQFKATGKIAKILDGQHRIAGLDNYKKGDFHVCVAIFIDMDMADQATLFSTVNFTQTKVNKSLVYDLFALAKARSPQKLCHEIVVMLNSNKDSPFYERIKRLGKATEGKFNERITQATFVSSLIKYMTSDEAQDRNTYLKGTPDLASAEELKKLIFRNMMIEEKDFEIADNIWNYFTAIRKKWPKAWDATGSGAMLCQTNGFRAFMRFFIRAYRFKGSPGDVIKIGEFSDVLNRIKLKDKDFNTDKYKPGSSGESDLLKDLIKQAKLPDLD